MTRSASNQKHMLQISGPGQIHTPGHMVGHMFLILESNTRLGRQCIHDLRSRPWLTLDDVILWDDQRLTEQVAGIKGSSTTTQSGRESHERIMAVEILRGPTNRRYERHISYYSSPQRTLADNQLFVQRLQLINHRPRCVCHGTAIHFKDGR